MQNETSENNFKKIFYPTHYPQILVHRAINVKIIKEVFCTFLFHTKSLKSDI